MTNRIIFCVCSTLAISVPPIVLKRCRKEHKKMQMKTSHSKIKADDEFGLAIHRKGSKRACFDCIRKPGENKNWKSNTSELVECAATKNGETCDGRQLIRLLRMGHWREAVFSRVEIWWNVGSKNGETRGWTTVHPAHRQVCHWWRWYGLWHRHRIEPFAKVTVILAQGEWSIAKDIGPLFRRQCKMSTNIL